MLLTAFPFFLCYTLLNLMLSWHDVRSGLLPNRLTCPLLWIGLLFQLCLYPTHLNDAVWGAISGYAALALLYWGYRAIRHREGLGYGDVKYFAALGAWHGWQSLPLLILIATSLACAFITSKAIFTRSKVEIKNPLPFGPFLGVAGFITAAMPAVSLRL